MTRLTVTPRPTSALRCAFCHGPLDAAPRPCRACATALHDECWDDAGVCPTLGCATWMRRIRVLPRRILASPWLLAAWLLAYAMLHGVYVVVVPAFAQMFRETGFATSGPTDAVFTLAEAARSPYGVIAGVQILAVSIVIFRRHRDGRWLTPALYAAFWLAIGFALFTGYAVFPPVVLCGRL